MKLNLPSAADIQLHINTLLGKVEELSNSIKNIINKFSSLTAGTVGSYVNNSFYAYFPIISYSSDGLITSISSSNAIKTLRTVTGTISAGNTSITLTAYSNVSPSSASADVLYIPFIYYNNSGTYTQVTDYTLTFTASTITITLGTALAYNAFVCVSGFFYGTSK